MKKYAPYILIFIILAGFFSPMAQVRAEGLGIGAIIVGATTTTATKVVEATTVPKSTADNAFQRNIDDGCSGLFNSSFTGCFLKLIYYSLFQLPAFLLWLSALFFNALISIGLSSEMTSTSTFLSNAWTVVRDLSNIFFILILLYISIKTILGLGGHEVKKMIFHVIIMALLINFSMFFTKVVIDT